MPGPAAPPPPPHRSNTRRTGGAAASARAGSRPGGGGNGRPPGPPGKSGGNRRSGGDGDGRPSTRRRRIRNALIALGALSLIGPLVAFAIGWLVYPVPSAEDIAVTQVATFTYADESPLATVRPDNVNRTSVPLDRVPESVQRAVLSAEDRSFFSNPGFSVTGIGRAVINQLTGGIGGGSTITQQYIKVTTGQDQFSLFRKFREVVLAAKISKEMTKEQILENYLNAIYLGRGTYGVQAASQAYFGKDVADLDVSEGAMLAGMIQSPSRWDPAKNPDVTEQRWNFVLDGMVGEGWLDPAERGRQVFPEWREPSNEAGGGIPGDHRGHVYNAARAELERLGISDTEINTQGLTVTTTIDPRAQQEAAEAVESELDGQPENLRASLVSVDPKTGAVLAYYGGANGVGLDYAAVLKQPGSSFKPFVVAAGLQAADPIGLGATYDGSSPQTLAGTEVANSEGVSCGNCSVKQAMTQSINTIFYRMALDIGPAQVAAAAHQAGIPENLLQEPTGGISLGDREVHPMDMAAAYATFANDGTRHEPFLVTRVTAGDGRVIFDRGAADPGEQVMESGVARNVTESMIDVASSSRIGLGDGRPTAVKTGTVQSAQQGQNNDAWTVGYTPSVSTAVWVGTDDNSPIQNSSGSPIFGRMLPGSMWQSYMSDMLSGTPVEQFSDFQPIGQAPVREVSRAERDTDRNGGGEQRESEQGRGDSEREGDDRNRDRDEEQAREERDRDRGDGDGGGEERFSDRGRGPDGGGGGDSDGGDGDGSDGDGN
ncbi:transglycosylase domain-containing protein [Pseudonocardia nematodicida]|uniref:Transglycosylase domain-containing protein n=1 Tax=Pseudonocardia nematodicida TaxID=1206997 RepID=A0ABV1KKJ3_9PSEU